MSQLNNEKPEDLKIKKTRKFKEIISGNFGMGYMKLFGSSGIRGIANKEITPELALNVGLVLGSRKKTAVIGRDPRVSAPMIEHVQINQALKFVAGNSKYTTVHLKGPFTYVIDDTLLIGSNTILEGDSNAVIKLANNAGWVTMKPMTTIFSRSQVAGTEKPGLKIQ